MNTRTETPGDPQERPIGIHNNERSMSPSQELCACCNPDPQAHPQFGLSRRHFLQSVGVAGLTVGALAVATDALRSEAAEAGSGGQPFPRGRALRVKPILIYDVPTRRDQTSWRGYGAIQSAAAAQEEAGRIQSELSDLKEKAEFPVEVQPVAVLDSQAKLGQLDVKETDLCLVYAAGSCTQWPLSVPMVKV